MKSSKSLGLVLALICFAGVKANAGRPQTLTCNNTVTFGALDCDGSARLDCGPGGALLIYNMRGCQYYKYENGTASSISQVAPLSLNNIYKAKLTRVAGGNDGTMLTINTAYGVPAPIPAPAYPSSDLFLTSGSAENSLQACGPNGGVKQIRGMSGAPVVIFRKSTMCSKIRIVDPISRQEVKESTALKFDAGVVKLDGLEGKTVILEIRSGTGRTGEDIFVHVGQPQ